MIKASFPNPLNPEQWILAVCEVFWFHMMISPHLKSWLTHKMNNYCLTQSWQTKTTFSIDYLLLFPMRLKDAYYAPVHITDSYQITRLTFVSLMLLIDYCTKTLAENVFIALCCV